MEVAAVSGNLPGRVVGVAFAPPASVALFERAMDLGVPILCDPEMSAYRLFGFGRSGWRALVSPTYWRRLARALSRGRRLRRPAQDPHQLGGDVVVDAQRRLRFIYRSRFPADRPSVEALAAALRDAAG